MSKQKHRESDAEDDHRYIIKMPPIKNEPHPKGIGWYCYETMNLQKDKIGQICTETGVEDTYGAFLQRSIRVAIKMSKMGITSADIVSLCTYNHLNSMVPSIAGQFLCSKVASFDPTLSQDDTNYLMKQVKPKIIFVTSNAIEMVEIAIEDAQCETEIVVFDDSSRYTSFDEFLKESPEEEEEFRPVAAKSVHDTAYIFFSSGTTGFPKGICCPHYGFLGQIKIPKYRRLFNGRFLGFASSYWITATLIFLSNLELGLSRMVMPTFMPEKVWHAISKYKINGMFAAPSQIFDILNVKPSNFVDISSLKMIILGGSSVSKEQMLYMREQFPGTKICQAYAQTEVSGCSTLIDADLDKDTMNRKAGSCGTPIDGYHYKIVDVDTGEIVGPNKVGELWLKTKFQMNGYYNLDSSDCWDKHGYMRTGDMLYYDEDKFFYHVDRLKEMLKYKSWHVQPAVIESVIAQHPAVHKIIVIGIPHPLDGDHPMAVVMVKKGFESTTPEEIKQFTNERVHDRQQLRGGLKIVNNIPLTPSGKIQRRMIRDLVLKNQI